MATHPHPIKRINPHEVLELSKISVKLNDTNWFVWKEQMLEALAFCDLTSMVVLGTLEAPNQQEQPEDFSNWKYNNAFARQMIWRSLEESQFVWIMHRDTAHKMWRSLASIHDPRGSRTAAGSSQNGEMD
jgi:hypothetical protein